MALYSSVLQMYLNWANSLLCERGVLVTDAEELQDGRIFALLIDVLNNAEITCAETEDEDETALNQIQAIFNYFSQHGIKLKSSPKDIMKGDVKSLLDLLWVIILHFTIHSKETPPGRRTLRYGRLSLMEWCADQLTEENFKMHKSITENFKGNNKLAELIEIYSHVSTEDDQESSPVGRLSTALIAVEETLGILKSLLSPADVIHGTANEYSLIIFLALLKRKVNLLVPDLGTEPSPLPALYQDTAEGTSEPDVTFADSGQGEEKGAAMGCDSLMDVSEETVACRSVEDSSGLQSHIGQPLTNGVLNQSGHESSHCSSEKERDTENDRTGGKHLSSISHGATGSHVTQNDIIREDHVEDVVSIPGVKMQESRFGDLHRIGGTSKNDEENTSDWHISSNQVDVAIEMKNFSLDAADDYPVAAAKYSFEDELLSLLETIGTEGKQLRQKLDSAQERELYLLGQLQETVSGKHEEKVIARLIQELEMLRKENRRLFRELADARGEVSLKKQKFDALQRHCHHLEGEIDRLKSGAGSTGSGAGQGVGYRNGTESRVEESREENETTVKRESALEKLMRRTAEENKQLRAELSSYRTDSSQTSKRNETTRDALRNVEEDNRDLRVKCQKLTRNIENMTVDLQTKEKRMGRYERYLEILRKQNEKLISHIGGEPLRGDGRVDVAKMELEEVKEEYKELRKRLEIAEEDRILLNIELDQIKAGGSRINSDAIDSVFQEFHNLPRSDIKKSKDDMNVSEADAVPKFPIAGSSLTSGKEDSSTVINEVISGRGEAEGSSNEVETAVKVLPEVKRSAATRSQLSDVSSLRSYDVSESETMQSDSDYAFEEYGSRTRAAHGGLVDGGVGGHIQRSFRSPSLGSLIRAHAMEDLRDGEADEETEKRHSLMGGRVSEASHGEGPRRVVVGSVVADRADNVTSKGTKTPSSRPSENYHLEHSIYYTPTLNLPMKRQPFEGRLDYETLPVNSQTPYKGRLAASRSETDILSDRKRNTSGKTHLNTVQSESNLNHKPREGAMYSSQYGSQKVHQIISGSSRVPRWRQLRYSRAKYLPPSKTGETLASPLPRSSPSKNVPLLYQSTPLTEGDVDRVERYYTPTAFMDGFATSHPSSPRNLNIPMDNEEEEFQPLPDQLTEPKKLADVTPPRNQNVSPRNHSSGVAAVKMKLSFEEANPRTTLEKRKSPTVLTLDENEQNTYPELDDKIVGGFASGGKMEHRGMEGGAADVMALRVIRKADSGISLSSAGYDNPSHPTTSKEVSYIHKMLSPADQSYANSIIDKYLTKN
ncbi:uncharacterized protein [Apostichopus japonicus]|uniref:uncharacterized protein isoform X2 n=1 Tax=Stichopus japonicus TaxID=307972 RepID=UPI003AB559D0